jgi:rubrerythrin
MPVGFNADEVFDMAIQIETNGAAFYRKAASLQSDADNRAFLESLASMEDRHQETFEKMKKELPDKDKGGKVFDPYGELSQYLAAMADTHGGEGSPSAADALTGSENMEDIITTALGLEKESILFYLGMKDMVPVKYGQEKIEDIIKEERKHVIQLTGILNKIKAS